MKISFIGDIMLGRLIANRFEKTGFSILDSKVKEILNSSDFVFGNLESPVSNYNINDNDHLAFRGSSKLLEQFSFIDCFSISNNHINDFGQQGMDDTIEQLNNNKINWNGLYKETYRPFTFEHNNKRYALFTCTDMMNIPFDKENPWKILKIDDEELNERIKDYKSRNYYIILFAHVGMLFTRFPNPPVRSLLHKKIDIGADLIVTVHSHVLGGMEYYKGKPIFHSIGDFVMDGNSYRRRRASILNIEIDPEGKLNWEIIPTIVDLDLQTKLPTFREKEKMLRSWNYVSKKMERVKDSYDLFFKKQYKIEILQHAISTIRFLLKTKGLVKTIKVIFKRKEEVKRVQKWASSDRTEKRYDDDAITENRKKFSQEELFDLD